MNTALRILFSGLRHAKGGSLKTNDEKSYYLGFFCILKKKISSTTLFAVASWFNNRSASVAQGLVTYPLYSVVQRQMNARGQLLRDFLMGCPTSPHTVSFNTIVSIECPSQYRDPVYAQVHRPCTLLPSQEIAIKPCLHLLVYSWQLIRLVVCHCFLDGLTTPIWHLKYTSVDLLPNREPMHSTSGVMRAFSYFQHTGS